MDAVGARAEKSRYASYHLFRPGDFTAPTNRQCDENRPECHHCSRHGVSCEYPPVQTRPFNPSQDAPSKGAKRKSIVATSPRPGLPSPELESMPTLELCLMHQYVTETAGTMNCAQIPLVRDMWNVSVPQMAFEYKPLLHTLLAVAAVHRATLLPNDANHLQRVYYSHINSALQQHRAAITDLNGSINEPMCMNAILISFYTLTLRSEVSTDPYELPLLWLSLAHGIRTVLHTVYRRLTRIHHLVMTPPVVDEFTHEYITCTPFQFLLHYHYDKEQMDGSSIKAYYDAVVYLETMFMSARRGASDFEIRKQFTAFPPMMPRCFLQLIADKQPRALVILAYLFALVKNAGNVWWLRGIPEREVYGIHSILPQEWKWTLDWPLYVILARSGAKAENLPVPMVGPGPSLTLTFP